MIQATSNCSPIKPSFKSSNTAEMLSETSEFIRDTNGFRNLDEDKLDRLKNIVDDVDVSSDSKVRGPLKTFALTTIALATGTIVARGTANKLFYLVKDKNFVKNISNNIGNKLFAVSDKLSQKAQSVESKTKKVIFKGLNSASDYLKRISTKGVKSEVGSVEYNTAAGENLFKKTVNSLASVFGFTTTASGLAVDKNKNGQSDMFEFNEKQKEKRANQKAVTELAAAVLDVI